MFIQAETIGGILDAATIKGGGRFSRIMIVDDSGKNREINECWYDEERDEFYVSLGREVANA